MLARILCLCSLMVLSTSAYAVDLATLIVKPPTNKEHTLLRGGAGKYNANRANGKKHKAIDIVANKSSQNKKDYVVMAVASGKVAYSSLNGSLTEGFGNTIIIDHGNGYYSLYAHLMDLKSVKLGANVTAGQTIGYMADLANGKKSTGNVCKPVVREFDKIQVHFELFKAKDGKAGISNDGSKKISATFKSGATMVDPTNRLKALGYKSY